MTASAADRERAAAAKGASLAAQVERVRFGTYLVPSQTEPGVTWTVIDTEHGLQCTCGAPVHVVRDTVGHANLSTTSRYAHARPTESSAQYLVV